MTALHQYNRLESLGLWKHPDDPQRKEVVVTFGDSSLVFRDQNELPLTHWSFSALVRINKGRRPALYAADEEHSETLEIDDPVMIEAVEKVRLAIRRAGRGPGRLRWGLAGVLLAFCFGVFFIWLPGALAHYAASLVPTSQARQIGLGMVTAIETLTGNACASETTQPALRELKRRLKIDSSQSIRVLSMGANLSTNLPGNITLINQNLITEQTGPEVVAGYLLLEKARAQQYPPLLDFFKATGTIETAKFVFSGVFSASSLSNFAYFSLSEESSDVPDELLIHQFSQAELTISPFAHIYHKDEDARKTLIENDPMKSVYKPVLSDASWLILQDACSS